MNHYFIEQRIVPAIIIWTSFIIATVVTSGVLRLLHNIPFVIATVGVIILMGMYEYEWVCDKK